MAEVHGTYDDRFAALAQQFAQHLDSGEEVGASIAVVVEGEPVVDIWGGFADEAKTAPWERDTITNVWSTTKTMISLCALVLVERGELDVNEKVSTYWPEFAAAGKQDIEVRHLMSHTSGVSAWAQPVLVEDLYDWESSTAKLAAQAPWWEPGTASGYHMLNFGHLIGEVIRRITGSQPGAFFAQEIAGPLEADFHIGLDPSEFQRVSNVIAPPPLALDIENLDMDSPAIKTFIGPLPSAEASWTPGWRQADIGAANGHGNARSVARVQSIVSNGGEVDGVRLLSPETIELIFDQQASGTDLVLDAPVTFGIGYGLPHPETAERLPLGRRCYWGGWGGSVIVNDLESSATIAYVMNRMGGGTLGTPRGNSYLRAAFAALGTPAAA